MTLNAKKVCHNCVVSCAATLVNKYVSGDLPGFNPADPIFPDPNYGNIRLAQLYACCKEKKTLLNIMHAISLHESKDIGKSISEYCCIKCFKNVKDGGAKHSNGEVYCKKCHAGIILYNN